MDTAATLFVVLVLIIAGVAVYLYLRHRQRIAAMSPQERELHEAQKEYELRVKEAEKSRKQIVTAAGKEVSKAEAELSEAKRMGSRPCGSYKSVRLFEDRVVTPHGTFSFHDGMVQAVADTTGNLAVSQRATVTRLATGGCIAGPLGAIMAGVAAPKKKEHDTRELYLLIESDAGGSVVECKPDDGAKVRQLAVSISNASKRWSGIQQEAEQAVDAATQALDQAETNRKLAVARAEATLEATKQDRQRLEAAMRAVAQSGI